MPIAKFQLPDGRIAKFEVPEGTTPEQAQELVAPQLAELSAPEPVPTEDTGFFDMMGRAVKRGAKQTGSLLGDVLPAMAATAVGADEYAARQMKEAEETQKEIEQKYGARYKQLSDVEGLGDVLPFVAETVAEQIPNLATAIIPGVGGGALAARGAAGLAAREAVALAAQPGASLAVKEAATLASKEAAKRVAMGQGVGTFLGSYALNAPEIFQNIAQETGELNVGAAALAGSVSAALDSFLPAYLLRQFTPGIKAGVVERILERSGMPAGIARQATAGAITGVASEGPTEAAQEAISIAAEKFVAENADAWGSKEFNRLVESGVRGAVGGGGISTIAGAGKGYLDKRAAAKAAEPPPPPGGKSALDELDDFDETTGEVIAPPEEPAARVTTPTPDKDADIPFDTAPPQEPEVTTEEFNALVEAFKASQKREPTAEELPALYDMLVRDKIRAQTPEDLFDERGTDTGVDTGAGEQGVSVPVGAAAVQGVGAGTTGAVGQQLGGAGRGVVSAGEREGTVGAPVGGEVLPAGIDDELRQTFLEQYGISDPTKPRFTTLNDKEQAVTQNDLMAAGVSGPDANYFMRQKAGGKVNAEAKAAFAKAAALKAGGQELLFAGPQQGLDFEAAMEEGPDNIPRAATPEQQGLDLAAAEEGVSRELPAIERPEFALGRDEGTVGTISPEMQREVDVGNFLDEVAAYTAPFTSREQKAEAPAMFEEFLSQYEEVANPKQVAQALANPESRGARQVIESLADKTNIEQLRQDFNKFAADRGLQKLGYTPEKSAVGLLERSHDLQAAGPRVVAILRALRSLPRAMLNTGEKAAMSYFSKFNYDVAMKSAAYDIANNVAEGSIVAGQGVRTGQQFREYLEENFPAAEVEYFDALVEAHKTSLKKAAGALKRMAQRQDKLSALKKFTNMSTQEIERYISTQPLRSGEGVAFKPLHPMVMERIQANDINGALAMISAYSENSYYKALAKRLLEMELPTGIYLNREQDMINAITAEVNPALEQFMRYFSTTFPEQFNRLFQNANVYQIAKGLKELREQGIPLSRSAEYSGRKRATLPKDVLENVAYQRLFSVYDSVAPSLTSDGFYAPRLDAINLNTKFDGGSYYVFLHETVHAATAYSLRNRDALNSTQKKALDELEKLYETAQKNIKVQAYGLTNLDEFIAEAFTNPKFQNQLRSLTYKDGGGSVWSKFIRQVMNLLGIAKDTVLFGTLQNADILMSSPRPSFKQTEFGGTLLDVRANKTKSAIDGSWQTAPDVKRNRAWLDAIGKRRDWNSVKSKLPNWLENLDDTARKYYLGAFTLRQLSDLINDKFSGALSRPVNEFINSVEKMLDSRNSILQQVSGVTKKWELYQSKNAAGAKRMHFVMIDATRLGYDPDPETNPAQPKTPQESQLANAWNDMDDTAKEIYREVRKFYEERIAAYRASIIKNVKLAAQAAGKTPEEIAESVKELQTEFNKNSVKPYFPLKRFGKYWLAVKNGGKTIGFFMFESSGQRNAARAEIKANLKAGDELTQGNSIRDRDFSQAVGDIAALKNLKELVNKAQGDVQAQVASGAISDKDAASKLQETIDQSLEQLYLMTLPDKSARKMMINRKDVEGASADMLRAFTVSAFHMAYQHSRFEHSRDMFMTLDAARGAMQGAPAEEVGVANDYINELRDRLSYIMNPTDTGPLPSTLSNISFIWYLTAPASALVNMMGVPAFGLPVTAARYGWGKTMAAMTSYATRFASTGFKGADGKFEMPTLERANLDKNEQDAYNRFVKDGLIDVTLAHDLAGMAEAPTNLYTGKGHKIMRGLSFMFHNAEKFNREVVAMATFKLAFEKTGDFEKAVSIAKDLTYKSMFDYSTLNKPRYFQNSYAKVILQFKQFSQQMTYLLGRSVYEMFKGESKEVRQEAINRLFGTLGMTALFAGATGMPMFWLVAATAEALHAAFSDDDEPPLDFENWFKNWTAETFGDFFGDSISRGVITQATGVNFADRMSLNDMWFRDSRKSQDEVTAFQNMLINLMGPTAALGVSAVEALKLYNDGHYYRALEKSMPAVLKQPLVGARYMTEGALTMKGDELVSDISAKEALTQMLGFSPERVAQRQKSNIEKKTREQEILNKRQDLLNAFFMAVDAGDDDFRERVLDKISGFNSMYPGVGISSATLMKSVKTRYKQRALNEAHGGIAVDKRLLGTLDEMGAYGEPD